jgi:hypothetical protein
MEIAQLKFKRIFEIRWSSIRDCIKPIIANIQPGFHMTDSFEDNILKNEFYLGSQALIGYLQEAMQDFNIQWVAKLINHLIDFFRFFHISKAK